MYTRPADLPDRAVVDALREGWDIGVATLEYRAVGFGSHHWCATDASGRRWFVTVDDLDSKRRTTDEPADAAFLRLRAALVTARAFSDSGAAFVVAPVPALDGSVVRRVSERYALALYPFVNGESEVGEYESASERLAVLDLIVMLHASDANVTAGAQVDDFAIQNRDELLRAIADLGRRWDDGPYSERARELLSGHAARVERLLARSDRLAGEARSRPDRMVLTHGEPHRQNVLRTSSGPMLIDWDTTLIAPPERDLWMLESGDGAVVGAYSQVTGTDVLPSMLDRYRLGWALSEVAIYTARFRHPHEDDADSRVSWTGLNHFLEA